MFFAAEIMATKGYAKALATEQPSVMKRILSFFKEASNYKNERLSRAAKSYYKLYQKMYAEFSAANRGNNALGGVEGSKRYSYSSISKTFFGGANINKNAPFTISPKGGIIMETAKGRKKVKYIPKSFFRRDVLYSLQKQLDFIFADAEDAIASELGIEYKNTIVIVDSQKGEGQVTYQVREIIEIEDDEARKIILKGHNYESKQRGNFSDQISSSFGDELLDNRESNIQREFGENTENNIGESQNNKNGIPEEDAYRIELDRIYADILYFDAINRGDEQTQERIIVESAKKARYTERAYHGTTAQFTSFSKKKARYSGLYGRGFYFTKSKSHSSQYGNTMEVFLKYEHPLSPDNTTITKEQIRNFLSAVAENEDYSIENYGTYNIEQILSKITSRDAFAVIQDINSTAIGDFVAAAELFNSVNETKFDAIVVPTETVIFNPEQIKSADVITYDDNGNIILPSERFNADNPDIRYSLDIDSKNSFTSATKSDTIKSKDLFTSTDEFYRQVPNAQRGAFSRSLANKTMGMIDGEIRTIYVCGYIFEADGYMQGHILGEYNEETKKLLGVKIREYEEINEDRESAALWTEAIRYAERGSGGDSDISWRARTSNDDSLLGEPFRSDTSGNNERIRETIEREDESFTAIYEKVIKLLKEWELEEAEANDNKRYSLDISSIREQTEGKVHAAAPEAYKPKLKERISTTWTNLQITFTNEHSFFPSVINMLESKKISRNY